MLRVAVPDRLARREVEGIVLRIRREEKVSYIAVDEGSGTGLKAWIVVPALLDGAGLRPGSAVSATISPRLGHVSRLENRVTDP